MNTYDIKILESLTLLRDALRGSQKKLRSLMQAAELLSRCELDDKDFEEYAMNVADAAMRLCGYRMSARENAYVRESEGRINV